MAVCGLAVGAMAAAPSALAQTAAESKPLAVVAFSSVDELMKDVDFLGSLGDQPNASQNIEMMIQMFTQQKGLAGLDRTKPIGVIVQSAGDMPAGAVVLPVTDFNALMDVAKGFGVTTQDAGNGLTQINTQQGQSVFAKNANGWAMLSISPDMLSSVPADPSTVLGPLTEEYDFAARIHVQNVPESYRQMAVSAMSEGARQGLSQNEDESDEEFKARQDQVNAQLEELKRFINELDQFTIGFAVDDQEKRAYIDFGYTAIPGTKLAQDIELNSNATTNFAGFIQPEAAMTLSFASKMTGADAAQLDQMVESLRKQVGDAIEEDDEIQSADAKEKVKSGVNDFIDALKATLQAGTMDGGASLNMTPDALTFVAGGFIADPAKVESGLKKIAEAAKEEGDEVPEVSWEAEQYKDVTFHTLEAPVEEDNEEARQMLGDKVDMAVGIGKEAVYFALGRNALDELKKVIDASAATPNKPIAPAEMIVSLGQIMNVAKTFADEDDKPQIEMIAEMLADEASGRDHVRIVGQPIDNGIRMRIEAEEGVLRALGMAAAQAQMQGAGF